MYSLYGAQHHGLPVRAAPCYEDAGTYSCRAQLAPCLIQRTTSLEVTNNTPRGLSVQRLSDFFFFKLASSLK